MTNVLRQHISPCDAQDGNGEAVCKTTDDDVGAGAKCVWAPRRRTICQVLFTTRHFPVRGECDIEPSPTPRRGTV